MSETEQAASGRGDFSAWQSKVDTTLDTLVTSLERIEKREEARQQAPMKVLMWGFGSLSVVGAFAVFVMTSEINKNLYPVQMQVTSQMQRLDDMGDLIRGGASERGKLAGAQSALEERLTIIETRMKDGAFKASQSEN
ncbi:hypothetical protein GC1_00024 [Gluconobacter phage GC1]|uniref:Uncharacterized protein n=1 Tax=Gluconobacter phage GC1 TaxID=2047788 RepID=A0A2I5AR88_9VIRU|nr:hypothetical protein FDJ08_gp24 [Gluconobacter phage GC1]ATS92592.1 hypothetical protein GC1_00024 [Gluconobacter phage GC1]